MARWIDWLKIFGAKKDYGDLLDRLEFAGYASFVADEVDEGKRSDLTGGGLIRSAGGWSEVLGLRRRKERMASDSRILGSGEFVEQMLRDVEERQADALESASTR